MLKPSFIGSLAFSSEENEIMFEFVWEYLEFHGFEKTLSQLDK